MGKEFFSQGEFRLCRLVSAAGAFLVSLGAFFYCPEIGQDEFRVDHFDVAHGIHRAGDMVDVFAFKTAHDLNDGIHLPDVTQKLVSKPFALARTGHKPCDIHKLNRRWQDFFGLREISKFLQALIGHVHDSDIRLDGAEWEVGRLGLARAGDGIEESGFSHIREPDDSCFEHRCGRLDRPLQKGKTSF